MVLIISTNSAHGVICTRLLPVDLSLLSNREMKVLRG